MNIRIILTIVGLFAVWGIAGMAVDRSVQTPSIQIVLDEYDARYLNQLDTDTFDSEWSVDQLDLPVQCDGLKRLEAALLASE